MSYMMDYTLTITHLDGRAGTQFLHLNIKIDSIKQNYATFYLWDPQDNKSGQDY